MKKKSLIETNPYLIDPAQRKMLVERSVRTSCGVEGIKRSQTNARKSFSYAVNEEYEKKAAK